MFSYLLFAVLVSNVDLLSTNVNILFSTKIECDAVVGSCKHCVSISVLSRSYLLRKSKIKIIMPVSQDKILILARLAG